MDKAEYKLKLDTIVNLAAAGDYSGAASVCDTIDWRRVKSLRTLCMVSEIYEAVENYQGAVKVLGCAYERSAISKTVLYRLTIMNVKCGNFEAAEKYCKEFEELSANDSARYLLRYKLLLAQKAPLSECIVQMEKYKEAEFTEAGALELAKLYRANNQYEKCYELCDDIIIWFAVGKTVDAAKAMQEELKPIMAEIEQEKAEKEKAKAAEIAEAKAVADENEDFRKVESNEVQDQLASSIRDVFEGVGEVGATAGVTSDPDTEMLFAEKEEVQEVEVKELEPETITHVDTEIYENVDPESISRVNDYSGASAKVREEENLEDLFNATNAGFATEVASGKFEKIDEKMITDLSEEEPQEDPYRRLTAKETDTTLGLTQNILIDEETLTRFLETVTEKPKVNEELRAKSKENVLRDAGVLQDMPEGEISLEQAVANAQAAEETVEVVSKDTAEASGSVDAGFKALDGSEKIGVAEKLENAAKDEERAHISDLEELEAFLGNTKVEIEDVAPAAEEISENVPEVAEVTEAMETIPDAVAEQMAEEFPEDVKDEEIDPIISSIINEPEKVSVLPLEPREFTAEEKEIFSYFATIPGISQQVTVALNDIHNHSGSKTSMGGNIALVGRKGSGKSRIAKAMIVAMSKNLGLTAVKQAFINAETLNTKSPAEVVAKMAGGFLIIEDAGDMSDTVVEELSMAMEFSTGGLILLIEDEKPDIQKLFAKHPGFASKFTSTVVVPVFTNDELVSFAKTYAADYNYRMDEMATLALYTIIGDNQSATEPVTIGHVKEMMDAAIERSEKAANKFGRRFSKKSIDEDGKFLLHEKDFEY